MSERASTTCLAAIAAILACACGAPAPSPRVEPLDGVAIAEAPALEVADAPASPRLAGYARSIHGRFSPASAMEVVSVLDRYFRVRGNHGYVKSLERVSAGLRDGGFADAGALRTLGLGAIRPTWTPRAASLELVVEGGVEPLIRFESEAEPDRAALLVRSDATPSTSFRLVRAEAVRQGADARGKVVLAEGAPDALFEELVAPTGAAGLLVFHLEPYHHAELHPDVAQFGYLPEHSGSAFGFSLSERSWERLRAATESGPATVRVAVEVATGSGPAGAVEARIAGSDPSLGAIVFVAHVDEPGAVDNASGVAALTELARAMRGAIEAGELPPPRRTIVFLWGQEMEVSREWLAHPPIPVGAGLVMDMVGADPATVGAPFLIERMPDPGAIWLRAPDAHTEWGRSEVREDQMRGHFLDDLVAASCAQVAAIDGPWAWRENPYEGGSDHQSFLARGLPAVLGWHFTDDAYHTTRDRLDRVSGEEMRRAASAFGAAAMSMASGAGEDEREIVRIVAHASQSRLRNTSEDSRAQIAAGSSSPEVERHVLEAWRRWYEEALASIDAWSGLDDGIAEAREDLRRDAARASARAAP